MAVHVEAAKRLLEALEAHASGTIEALERDGGAAFVTAVDEREQILGQLSEVVDAIVANGGSDAAATADDDLGSMLAEIARAAAAALESQQQLMAHAARERNRLAAVLHNTNRPDAVARQYAVATGGTARRATLSVSG
jgi:hypothetical protein